MPYIINFHVFYASHWTTIPCTEASRLSIPVTPLPCMASTRPNTLQVKATSHGLEWQAEAGRGSAVYGVECAVRCPASHSTAAGRSCTALAC